MCAKLFGKTGPELLAIALFLFPGCAWVSHDEALDNQQIKNDQPVAEEVARTLATADFDCKEVTDQVLSRQDVEGAPLGPVWSVYRVSVQGCGKSSTYTITCKGVSRRPYCYKEN